MNFNHIPVIFKSIYLIFVNYHLIDLGSIIAISIYLSWNNFCTCQFCAVLIVNFALWLGITLYSIRHLLIAAIIFMIFFSSDLQSEVIIVISMFSATIDNFFFFVAINDTLPNVIIFFSFSFFHHLNSVVFISESITAAIFAKINIAILIDIVFVSPSLLTMCEIHVFLLRYEFWIHYVVAYSTLHFWSLQYPLYQPNSHRTIEVGS